VADQRPEEHSLHLTPAGHLRAAPAAPSTVPSALSRALTAFADSEAAGLFELAAHPSTGGLPRHLAYWHDFAARSLTSRCHTPGGAGDIEALPPLADQDVGQLLLEAPPMPGAEYLSADVLQRLWSDLDEWVRGEAAAAGGLEAFLKLRAPLWQQVGRVCFHLAENKKDPDLPFAFLATYAPRISSAARVRYQPLSNALREFAGVHNRTALVHLLTPVERAGQKSALIRDLVDSGDIYHPLAWDPSEAYRFLQEIPLYEESGVLVRVPDWWARRPRPQVAVTIGSNPRTSLGIDTLLDFQVDVALGDTTLSAREWKQLLAHEDGLVLLKGQWVELDRERLQEALSHWERVQAEAADGGISFVEGMRLLAGAQGDHTDDGGETVRAWSFVDAGSWLKDLLAQLRSPETIQAALPAKGLRTELRHYQESGVRWLWLLSRLGLGACLADDMGLGKTIQVLALLLMQREPAPGPSLLVLPASLLANWKAEIEKFAPGLRTVYLHPSMGTRPGEISDGELSRADVVLTTYSMVQRIEILRQKKWNLVILDEAQAIKNPGARQTKAVKELKGHARIALTGTPVENRLSDLWSLFDFLSPGLLGSAAQFKVFSAMLEKREGERFAPLRSLVKPYILRRLKTDRTVIADLPEKTEVLAWCGLTKKQAALYQKTVEDLEKSLHGLDGIERRGLILSTLLALKQICNHPSQRRGDAEWNPRDSGKFARLGELCEEISSRQGRVLVFSQFREIIEPLASFLAGVFGRHGLVLHGGTPVKERRSLVEAFQSDDGPPFFVLSLKAGGVGLNLTAAAHVIHFDRWWNPAVENQATDRAFRIGQKKNVLVHKFVCRGTVEERIDALITEKTSLARDLLEAGGEALLTEMSDDQLLATVALDIDRAQAEA
jgi:non-specific serine/threonine protein kinase